MQAVLLPSLGGTLLSQGNWVSRGTATRLRSCSSGRGAPVAAGRDGGAGAGLTAAAAAAALCLSASLGQRRPSLLLRGHGARRRRMSRPRTSHAAAGNWPFGYASSDSAAEALEKVQWPAAWPYTEADFGRQDEGDDTYFYEEPRLCTHVDDSFISILKGHYATEFAAYPEARILDICSSWISHYPEDKSWSHVSITGMNEQELRMNKQADDFTVRNLNVTPELPYDSASFDIVTCTVSFDYLNKPLEVMREVARVLKPGGKVILSTSNRCFPTKAVNIWVRSGDLEHVLIYGSYIHYAGEFEPPEALDLSPPQARIFFADPVFIIQAKKKM